MYRFLKAQLDNPTKNDWGQTIKNDIEMFKIGLSIKEIENMSKKAFKNLVKKKEKEASFEYLLIEKSKHSKVAHINYREFGMQDYLQPNASSIQESKFLFMLRCRMIDVRCNYRGKYTDTLCPLCVKGEYSQPHLLVCEKLGENTDIVTDIPEYETIFQYDLEQKMNTSRILKTQFDKRKKQIKPES